jgi:hypothetical protein
MKEKKIKEGGEELEKKLRVKEDWKGQLWPLYPLPTNMLGCDNYNLFFS